MKKWIVRLVVLFAVLFVAGLVVVFLSLNTIVKHGVERVGPMVTKTEVKLESANISPFTGSGQLHKFSVGNPPGYKTPSAIQVGDVKLAVKVKSLFSPVIGVDLISVDGAEVTFEGGLGGNNLSQLMDNLGSMASADKSTTKPEEKPVEGGKKLRVKEILIRGTKVNASLTGMGGKTVSLSLPEIHMTDIGNDQDGVSSAELSKKIIQQILTETLKALSTSGGVLGKELQGLGKDSGKQVESVTKGLKSLFKK
jgi:hypothetical protein